MTLTPILATRLRTTLAKRLMWAGLWAGCSSVLPARDALVLTKEGQTRYTVVVSAEATVPERYAAEELTNFLWRVTGAVFPVVSEGDAAGGIPAVHLGWTAFARGQGIDPAALGEEEWVIRTVGDDLVLSGGRPRGTLYAVYEFLERQIGCHWLDRRTEVIPERPTLALGALDIRAKPRFWTRHLMCPLGTPDDQWRFLVRNKNYRYDFRSRSDFFPEGAFYPLTGTPGIAHTFHAFVNAKGWFETHPEYFSMNRQGKRVPAHTGAGPGQLCLTHPDVRRLTVEKLRAFIAKDRTQAAAQGILPPIVYEIKHNDQYDAHCQCDACQAIARREGGESGPNLDFLNAIGAVIEADYPDVVLATHAYNLTRAAPKTLRPRRNVLVDWCDVYSRSDPLRPLCHPHNRGQREELEEWGRLGTRLGIVDYWSLLTLYPNFPLPTTTVQCLGPDLRLFADCGAERLRTDMVYYREPGENFIALKFWLGYQLLVDPDQPVEPLIETFMKGYYGAAAPTLQAYLSYLTARIDAEAQYMLYRNAPHRLAYLDLEFFRTAERLFDEAQARVEPGSLPFVNMLRERFVVDSALLHLWPWLERKLPESEVLPFDKERVVRRFEQGWANYDRHWFNVHYRKGNVHGLNKDGMQMQRLAALFRDPQFPARFRALPRADVADFNWLTFPSYGPRQQFLPDADAVGGMTATFAARGAIQAAEEGGAAAEQAIPEVFREPVEFGVTGGATLTLELERIPADEQYHLYEVGPIDVKPGTVVWALKGRRLRVEVDRLHVPEPETPVENLWQGHLSLKFTGPAYVPGSTRENGVFMDRVLLVRSGAIQGGGDALRLALPLERLVAGGARPDQSIYANFLRGGTEALVWSPTGERNFNLRVEALGELALNPELERDP